MAVVREILSQEEFHAPDGSSRARGIAIGKTTVDLLQPFCRVLDLLDASEDTVPLIRIPTARPSRSAFQMTAPCRHAAAQLVAFPAPSCFSPRRSTLSGYSLNLAHEVGYPASYSVEAEVAANFAYGSKVTVKNTTLRLRVDPRAAERELFQPLLDQLRSGNVLKRIEAARALASVAPRSLESTLLSFRDDAELRRFAPLALHRLNTQASTKAMADLLNKTTTGSFEHWQAAAYLANDKCGDEPW